MRRFLALVQSFKTDQRGAFAVIFGIIAIVLVATAGAVVDFTTIEQARARAQDALDSAALGLQPRIFETGITEGTLQAAAENLLIERLSNEPVTAAEVDDVTFNPTDGTLRLEAHLDIPMAFVSLVGVNTIRARLVSEATRRQLAVEIAMVLDNSTSMNQESRMTKLKEAARCALNILYNSIPNCDAATVTAATPLPPVQTNVKIAIVPFTHQVNIGSGFANEDWMDQDGVSPISNDNFDDDDNDTTPFTGAVDRFALFTAINSSWGGCAEARPYPYDTNDTEPDPAIPATLFVPQFAPDEPGSANSTNLGFGNSYLNDSPNACPKAPGTWTFRQVKTRCSYDGTNSSTNHNRSCNSGTTTTNTITTKSHANVTTTSTNNTPTTTPVNTQPATLAGQNNPAACTDSWTSSGSGNNRTNTYTRTCTYDFSLREFQERLCKYTGNINAGNNTLGGHKQTCPASSNDITPLTNSKSTINSAITAMSSNGYTNIHIGAIWGLHVLSPTVPFTEGNPYETGTSKVMIIMTDGENTVNGYSSSDMNKAEGYLAYGYPGPVYNGRIYSSTYPSPNSDAQVTAAIDSRLVETCTSAKNAGIEVYTIGLATNKTGNPAGSNQAKVEAMLTACASGPDYDFFPQNSSELVTTFQEIAGRLADLRLAQ